MIKIFKDIDELNQYAVREFIRIADQSIKERGRFLATLSGGNTPMKLHEKLADENLEWSRIHFFWGDERCVPVDDAGNSYGQAKKVLFDKITIPEKNIHRVISELKPAEASNNYARTLELFADPPLAWPRFDLVFLGMGDDGHTASLFPGSPVKVDTPTRAVIANYQDRPANRVTLTQNVFNNARNVYFLVTGKSKAQTLFNVLNGPQNLELYPAQRIKLENGELTWLVDEQAASLLKSNR